MSAPAAGAAWRAWVDAGRVISDGPFAIFTRTLGRAAADAPTLFFLHGFPTTSFDYAAVLDSLAARYHCVLFDFLGFGASSKPAIRYTIDLQTHVAATVARAAGVTRAIVIAHDYGVTIGQELLARAHEGRAPFAIDGMLFMNGGVASQLHRPIAMQRLLASPLGPVVAPLVFRERLFAGSMRKIVRRMDRFDVAEHYAALVSDHGARVIPRLLQYIAERKQRGARWRGAIEDATVPLAFVWGLEDPISGAHMLEWVRTAAPRAAITALAGIGHYPQIEDPDRVVTAIDAFVTTTMALRAPAPRQ